MADQNSQNITSAKIETSEKDDSSLDIKKRDEGSEMINKFGNSIEGATTKFQMENLVGSENSENMEESVGFSENENQKKGDGGPKKRNKDDQDNAQKVRASLASATRQVTNNAMSRVVKIAIHKEIKEVQSNVSKLSRDTIGNAYELSEAVKKLKKLKFILKNLAHWTIDFLKSLFDRTQEKKTIYDTPLPLE